MCCLKVERFRFVYVCFRCTTNNQHVVLHRRTQTEPHQRRTHPHPNSYLAAGSQYACCRLHAVRLAVRVFLSWLRSQIWRFFLKKSLATDKNEGSLAAKSCSQAKNFSQPDVAKNSAKFKNWAALCRQKSSSKILPCCSIPGHTCDLLPVSICVCHLGACAFGCAGCAVAVLSRWFKSRQSQAGEQPVVARGPTRCTVGALLRPP